MFFGSYFQDIYLLHLINLFKNPRIRNTWMGSQIIHLKINTMYNHFLHFRTSLLTLLELSLIVKNSNVWILFLKSFYRSISVKSVSEEYLRRLNFFYFVQNLYRLAHFALFQEIPGLFVNFYHNLSPLQDYISYFHGVLRTKGISNFLYFQQFKRSCFLHYCVHVYIHVSLAHFTADQKERL